MSTSAGPESVQRKTTRHWLLMRIRPGWRSCGSPFAASYRGAVYPVKGSRARNRTGYRRQPSHSPSRQDPLAVQAILTYLARSGAPAPPAPPHLPPPHSRSPRPSPSLDAAPDTRPCPRPAAAPLRPPPARAPVAAQDSPRHRAIAVLTLAFAPVPRAVPGLRLGIRRAGRMSPTRGARRGSRGNSVYPSYARLARRLGSIPPTVGTMIRSRHSRQQRRSCPQRRSR
jgi:hypothetical protein